MNRQFWLVLTLGSLTMGLATQAQAKLYKWLDENGEVHYGDKIPPQYVRKGHTELSKHGVNLKKVERAKTREEIELELTTKTAEQKRGEEARRIEAVQRRKDKILLDTFTVERDVKLMRDGRIGALDSNIALTRAYNNQLEKNLEKTQNQVDILEQSQREIPENIIKKIKRTKSQIAANSTYISKLEKDKVLLQNQFETDLRRFRELKGIAISEEQSKLEANKASQLNHAINSYIDETNTPEPKGYFYGAPVFPSVQPGVRSESLSGEELNIETSESIKNIRTFFKYRALDKGCVLQSNTYSCQGTKIRITTPKSRESQYRAENRGVRAAYRFDFEDEFSGTVIQYKYKN